MQTLGAYLIFLLVVAAVGLAIILSAVAVLMICEGLAWAQSRPEVRIWEHSVLDGLARAGVSLQNEFNVLRRAIHVGAHH